MSEATTDKPNGGQTVVDLSAQVIPRPVEIRLGSLAISNPKELVARATELANALAQIINKKKLYTVIKGKKGPPKKHVYVDGWTTLGAMLGVVPVEEYCNQLEGQKGYIAKVKLIRVADGVQVGGASAECRASEPNWDDREFYTLRSMAITRATGKAFRLSFAWIMKLAGFEAAPADELYEHDGSQEEANAVGEQKVAELKKKLGKKEPPAPQFLFYTLPERHNGHYALLVNLNEYASHKNPDEVLGLKALLSRYGRLSKAGDPTSDFLVAREKLDGLIAELKDCQVEMRELGANG